MEAAGPLDRSVEERLAREFRDFLSLTPEIRRSAIGEIPRPQGKAVRVVDRRADRR